MPHAERRGGMEQPRGPERLGPEQLPGAERLPGADRYAAERREIRAAMDRAARDPAFAQPPYRQSLDRELPGPDGPRPPRESLREMPGLSTEAAERHLNAADLAERPWLRPAMVASEDARRVIATVDQGEGHHLRRHEGAASGDAARERVERLCDPANPDAVSRGRADDAFKVGADGVPRRHVCRDEATAISDPDAFATAVARAMEHPDVRKVLDRTVQPEDKRREVEIPINELLGPKGHESCAGYRLIPIDGSIYKAMDNRAAWVKAQRDGAPTDAVEPTSSKIDTFEGGTIKILIQPRDDRSRYEIMNLFPKPPKN